MRILYVTNDLPWPLTSGYLRHYHLIRGLAERHQITLLSLVKDGHAPDDGTALEPFLERLVTRPASLGRRGKRARLVARAAALRRGGDPASVELGEIGARLHAEAPFDVLLLSGKRTYPVLEPLAGIPLVADLCDATSTRLRRQARHARIGRRLPLALEYLEVRRVERALVRRAQHVLFASERDREDIMGHGPGVAGQARATVIPNGVDLGVWHRETSSLGSAIVLTGAMDYPPNADAAQQLATAILPLVRHEAPEAEVLLVGRDPTPDVQALADLPGVTVTGFVDDVRPYLERAAVFAAPIRFGAGIQNKVLEAMAMEVPVVASPLAADGLRTVDGRTPPIDIASTPAQFAAAILRRYREAGTSGPNAALRTYVAAEFDWARQAARVAHLLEDAAAGGRAARPASEPAVEPATDPVPER